MTTTLNYVLGAVGAAVYAETDPVTGGMIGLVGPDGDTSRIAGVVDPSTPILVLGGDHPYEQWYGAANDGLGKMYRDYGITPYLAINTEVGGAAPGDSGYMSWDQLKAIQAGGCEILGHAHRHVHQWGRCDTGIQIEYLGSNGTATVDIDGSPKTLTLDADTPEDASFDLTNASYDTLAELAAAINAVNGGASWLCTLAPELTGTERSTSLLSINAPRSVKTPSAFEDYFAAGSGIILSYTGSAYKTAFIQRTSANGLDIYLDGVRRASFDLANASYDTLSELVAAIDALAVTGLTADICDDTGGTAYQHYTQGDEKSINLVETLYLDITMSGGVVPDGTGKANGARLCAGLPHSYLIDRQWQANKDAASIHGVTMLNWAQSGGGWHQWYLTGQNTWRSIRTNQAERNRFPGAQFATVGPDYIRTHYVLNSTDNSADCIIAAINALADSPGAMMDLLCHALTPAAPAGKNGYTITASSSLNAVDEDDWLLVLAHAKALRDAGSIVILTPEDVRRCRKWAAKPMNMVFNSSFQNDGTTITGVSGNAFKIPGWELNTNVAHITACTVDDAGDYNKVTVTANATTNTEVITASLALERGKSYRVGCRLDVSSYSSGTGVQLVAFPVMGALPGQLPDDTSPSWSTVWSKADADLSMVIHVPAPGVTKPRVRGLIAGTFNIVTGSADTLSIAMDAYSAVAVTLTAGAARTAKQIADEINAAFAGSATYTGKQEYWTVASVQGNKVVVESPYAGEEYWNRITITGNGTATVFGYSQCVSVPTYGSTWQPWVPVNFRARGQMVGTYAIIKPYCHEIDQAY